MLAGLAPLHAERLASRGGPRPPLPDPLDLLRHLLLRAGGGARCSESVVGPEQLLYGSDRPVVEPDRARHAGAALDWEPIAEGTRRALGAATGSDRSGDAAYERHGTARRRQARGRARAGSTRAGSPPFRVRADAISPAAELQAFVARARRRARSCGSSSSSTTRSQRVYEELLSDAAPDRVADLLDGRPRHRLSRPRRLRGRRRRRQRRRARGASGDRRPAARARLSRPARAFTSRPRTSTACATPARIRRSRCTSTRRRCCAWAPTWSARTACSRATRCPPRRSCARSSATAPAARLGACAPLHAVCAGDQDQADHLRREQPVLDHARGRARAAPPARAGRRSAPR